ncbi:MAG: hypothetical protein K2Y23_14795 [Cyanobacteria bacterium]|nr:hypothetical protein [Cyanobacteriota bacterium]
MKYLTPTRAVLSAFLTTVFTVGAAAQEPVSASPAKELAALMAAKKLDSIAARMPDDREQFVGALVFPGQLMVVWAKTTAPAVVNEKLIRKEYKEVYIDLNSASVLESRHFVTDLGPDGLRSRPAQKQGPSDSHDLGQKSMRFDGNWREDKMSENDYMKAHAEADAAYAKAVQALIDELKKG